MNDRTLVKRIRAAEDDITWTYHSRLSTRFHYVTVAVPKTGCTTIKRALHELEELPPEDRQFYDHDGGQQMRLAKFSADDVAAAFTDDSWVRFTFVRNPYDRLLSAWKSKILSPHDTAYAAARQRLCEAYGYPTDTAVAFGDFVRFVVSTQDPSFSRDGHWERQVVVGRHDLIPYNVVGRFENFAEDFRLILERVGAPAHVVELSGEVTNPSSEIPPAAAYDAELAAIVYDYYRDDFETFGYDRDSWLTFNR